jgi:hypothetical protein
MTSLAAIGLCLHSGWASAVLIAHEAVETPQLVARRRIILCKLPHSKQPYHAAENMELAEAEAFIADCRLSTVGLAVEALKQLHAERGTRKLTGVGIAASSARSPRGLSTVLHSHALIHAAEGAFYRDAMGEAAKRLGLKLCAITNRAACDFLERAPDLRKLLERIGKAAGSPWTVDEKCASLAAFLLLPGLAQKFHLETLSEPIG